MKSIDLGITSVVKTLESILVVLTLITAFSSNKIRYLKIMIIMFIIHYMRMYVIIHITIIRSVYIITNLGTKLDWDVISMQYWHDTEEDYDRMRRKQAEFLVKGHVPTNCICGLIVLTPEQEERAKAILQQTGTNIPIYVDNKRKYFYP